MCSRAAIRGTSLSRNQAEEVTYHEHSVSADIGGIDFNAHVEELCGSECTSAVRWVLWTIDIGSNVG
jgi:hypothetical protein